jgi:LPS sulfotransferase NodH
LTDSAKLTDRILVAIRSSFAWQWVAVIAGDRLGLISNRNFLILTSPRSGSNLLVDYLRGHRCVHCHGEILNRQYCDDLALRAQTDRRKMLHFRSLFIKLPRTRLRIPRQFVGAKIQLEQFPKNHVTLPSVLEWLGNPRIIILYRKDLLETYVSRQIAYINNRYYSKTSSNELSVSVDWERFRQYCDVERTSWDACLAAIGTSCDVHFLDYDSLVADPRTEVAQAFRFIGVESDREPVPQSVRQNPWPMSKKVINFAELETREDFHGSFRYLSLRSSQDDGKYASSTMFRSEEPRAARP